MRTLARSSLLAALAALLGTALAAGPAPALEDGLLGVRIGSSYRELVERFGQPQGILFPAGGGLLFQTVAMPSGGGLPEFGAQTTTTMETPVWVLPIRASVLAERQTQWVYDLRKKSGVSLGVVLSGEGADAVVTDVIVAGFPQYLKEKPTPVRTQKGITLQSTFSEVLKRYGYPPIIEIYVPSGVSAAGAGAGVQARGLRAGVGMGARGGRGGAMRAGGGGPRGGMGGARGGPRGRMGGRGRRGMGGQVEAPSATVRLAQSDHSLAGQADFQVVLTAAFGGRRGGMGGPRGGMGGPRGGMGMRGGMGGGMRGGAARGTRGRGALPPLTVGQAPGVVADRLSATAIVEHQQISFSRDCILVYEGIAFTLHDMRVFRIHVSE